MTRIESTSELFVSGGLNCAQAILTAFGETTGIDPETARMLGRPLGGGVAASGQMCGFLTGAVLVLAHAFAGDDEATAREGTIPRVAALLKTFREKHGAVTCNELLGVERGTEEGERRIKEEGIARERCPGFGRDAAAVLEQILKAARS
jgi:C_GCAxxG_C_C family probable redox protein